MKVKVDKTVAASVILHVLVIGWGLISFSTKAFVMPDEDTVAVDVISADQLSHVTAGIKTGKKENPKPLVEKVAEAKPTEDATGKVTEKAPVVTETAPPKPVEKPVEKKPDPPKPVAETKPKEEPKKEEPKPVEKKPDAPDPIAEALKKEEKKPPPPKPVAATPPPQPKPKERPFDQSKIAALLDKRDPSHQAATGETLNSNAALGTSKGKAADNSATWGAMFKEQVNRCWKVPYGGIENQNPLAVIDIRLKRDGSLDGAPVAETQPTTPYLRVYLESAMRALLECQPYKLPPQFYDEWKYFAPEFAPPKT